MNDTCSDQPIVYSDSEITTVKCPRCRGTGDHPAKDGRTCPRCMGRGEVYPLRREALARAFASGRLPEQHHAPFHRWCEACRPNGVLKRKKNGNYVFPECGECYGKTIIEVEHE